MTDDSFLIDRSAYIIRKKEFPCSFVKPWCSFDVLFLYILKINSLITNLCRFVPTLVPLDWTHLSNVRGCRNFTLRKLYPTSEFLACIIMQLTLILELVPSLWLPKRNSYLNNIVLHSCVIPHLFHQRPMKYLRCWNLYPRQGIVLLFYKQLGFPTKICPTNFIFLRKFVYSNCHQLFPEVW